MRFLDGNRGADEFGIEFSEGGSAEALTTALETEHLDEHALIDPVARAVDNSAQRGQ